jgi:hypothetical protein
MSAQPCNINGRDYPSQRAAARDWGVSYSAISRALAEGSENRVGCRAWRPVAACGREWPNIAAAARDVGKSPGVVRYWLGREGFEARMARWIAEAEHARA